MKSSVSQDISVVSVDVWDPGEAATGSSSQPWSTSYSSQCGRTFRGQPLILKRLRKDYEDVPNTPKTPRDSHQGSEWARGLLGARLRVAFTQGILSQNVKVLIQGWEGGKCYSIFQVRKLRPRGVLSS